MYKEQPSDDGGLTAIYTFQSSDISKATNGKVIIAMLPLQQCNSEVLAAVMSEKVSL